MVKVEPKEVLQDFLRSRVTDPRGRHTSTSDSFNGDDSTTTFTLTPTSGSKVYNITAVTVGGVAQEKWEEYSFDPSFQSKVITFTSAPASGTGNVVVTYDEGTESWIYPNLARKALNDKDYPRINISIIGETEDIMGVEVGTPAETKSTVRFSIDVWAKMRQKFTISDRVYEGDKLALVLARMCQLAFRDNVSDVYPKLQNYKGLNLRDAVWEDNASVAHAVFELQLDGVDIGE